MRLRRVLVAFFAMAMPVAGVAALQVRPETFGATVQGVKMPDLRGLTLDSATSWLRNHKLPRPRVTRRPSPDPFGIVIDQSPEAGQPITPNTVVNLTVSSGPPSGGDDVSRIAPIKVDSITVPNLIGETKASLVLRLLFSHLQFQDAGSTTDDQNAGKVVKQEPLAGTRVLRNTSIQLWFGRGTPVTVPDLQHNTVPEAEEILRAVGLQLGKVDSQPRESEPGRIVRQRPAAQDSALRGDRVRVWFGYITTVQVPDLRDSTVEGASRVLQQAGLKLGDVQRVPTPNGTGRVGSQQPLAKEALARGSAVSVIIQEAAPVTVPNVVGMEVSHAAEVLKGAGLVANPVDSAESKSPAHTVLVQRPQPGTSVARGSSVYIQIAILSQFVTVPAVTNQTQDRARQILDSVGLRLGSVNPLRRQGASGLITSQGPVANSKVLRGTSVAVWVAVPIPLDTVPNVVDTTAVQRIIPTPPPQPPPPPPPPVPQVQPGPTVPDVVRKSIDSARAALQGLRLRPQRFDTASSVPSENDVVLRQEPAAGQVFPGDSVVRLWVGYTTRLPIWLIVLGSLAGIGGITATVKTVNQIRRDREWRRRLTFKPRSVAGTPRIPDTTNPLARPEMQLIPRPGIVRSGVVGDGPLIRGEP